MSRECVLSRGPAGVGEPPTIVPDGQSVTAVCREVGAALSEKDGDRLLLASMAEIPTVGLLVFNRNIRFVAAAGGALANCGLVAEHVIGATPRELGGAWCELEHYCADALNGLRTSAPTIDWSPDPQMSTITGIPQL